MFERHPFDAFNCTDKIFDPNSTSEDIFLKNLELFSCADSSKIDFKGTLVSPRNSYFHFEMESCNETSLRQIDGYQGETCASQDDV